MKCSDFNNKLASVKDINSLSPEMLLHMEKCASCRKTFRKTEALFTVIEEEKSTSVSPYIGTRIMAQIESQESKPKMVKPAFVSVMAVILMIFGFFSAELFLNQPNMTESTEIIASEYYFSDNPGAQLEETWINTNTYQDE